MRPLHVPIAEIQFAAKTGFLSKAIWEEFFASGSYSWRCKQWVSFLERGFFKPHPSVLAKHVIVLNRNNLKVVKLVGVDFASPPYISQLIHDETMARFLLVLKEKGLIQSFQTEMELKKADPGSNKARDASDRTKYPDAVIEVSGNAGALKIAIELELTRKDPKRYKKCLDTYATRSKVHRVIFIARSNGVFATLKRAMVEVIYPDYERPIGFSELSGWMKDPGSAVIYFSESVTSIEKLAAKIGG